MAPGTTVGEYPVQADGTTQVTAPTYATAARVASILGVQPPSEAADEGQPTLTQWNEALLAAEGHVDRICGTSWRPRRQRLEFHDFTTWASEEAWLLLQLHNRPIRALDAAKGDAFEVWNGGTWENWLTQRTEGRAADYWLQHDQGYLRIRRLLVVWDPNARVALTYRWGNADIPDDIAEATALLAAIRLSGNDTIAPSGRGGDVDRASITDRRKDWKREAYERLAPYLQYKGGA